MKPQAFMSRQGGFTLIELMIGMVLGLFIVIALITLLVNVNRNNTELAKANRVIENGRLALQLLQTDISHAGFLGGFIPNYDDLTNSSAPTLASAGGQVPTAVPDPCLAYSATNWTSEHKANLVGIHAAAYQVPSAGTAPVCSGVVTNPKALTDVLVVRHLEACTSDSGGTGECSNTTAASNPDVYMQQARCSTDTTTHVLGTSGWTLKKRNCTDLAPIRRFASTLYYVRTYANASGDGIPTLMRSTFAASGSNAPTHLSAQPLIEGIEGFHVEFGLDNKSDSNADVDFTTAVTFATGTAVALSSPTNRGDGNPDTYVSCTSATPCTAAALATGLMNAVTAKIYVLVRSEATTAGHTDTKTYNMGSLTMGPFNDGYKRHVFTQTIRFNNVSGRRETP